MPKFSIVPNIDCCRLTMIDLHTACHLDLPIRADDAHALIYAAFRASDENPRVEFHGILADRMAHGVRVRQVAKPHWFDIPWTALAQGVDVVEVIQ